MLSLLLAIVTVAVYASVAHNSFINYDDDKYILGLPEIKQPLGWDLVRWSFTTFALANWHPLTWLSHALDYHLFHSAPAAVHLENVFFHAASSVLLFVLLQNATGKTWRSLAVAFLFALHPLNVESVAWAAERKNVLSMFFFMLTLWAYGRFSARRTIGRYSLCFAAFALGILAKPQIVTLPFVLLLWDIWPLGRWLPLHSSEPDQRESLPRLLMEKVPFFLLAAASSILTLRAQRQGGAVATLVAYPIKLRIENAIIEYVHYIGSTFWPLKLAVLYPYPPHNFPVWHIALATAILLAITVFVVVAWKRRYLAIGWFWFLGTLIPMIGLVQVGLAARADRYMYLPGIGLFLMLVWGISDWAQEHSISRRWLAAFSGTVLVVLAILTSRQLTYWHDSESLWRHTLEVTRRNDIAEANLGTALLSDGREDEAVEHFRRAVAIDPGNFLAQLFLGIDEGKHGNAQGAILHFKTALQRPAELDMVEMAYSNLGNAYRNLHDYAHARHNFTIALEMDSSDSGAAIGMGLMAQHDRNLPEAIHWYSQATLARPNAVASMLLARALEKNGQPIEARQAYEQAVRASKDLASTQRVVQQMLDHLD